MPRARKYDGTVYRRAGTLIWWIRYRDRNGIARRESSQTADWQEANRKLRERLQARDDNLLEVVRKGETLAFGEWADRFLENYSKFFYRLLRRRWMLLWRSGTRLRRGWTWFCHQCSPIRRSCRLLWRCWCNGSAVPSARQTGA